MDAERLYYLMNLANGKILTTKHGLQLCKLLTAALHYQRHGELTYENFINLSEMLTQERSKLYDSTGNAILTRIRSGTLEKQDGVPPLSSLKRLTFHMRELLAKDILEHTTQKFISER